MNPVARGADPAVDHDPRPLYYQFAAERSGAFTWQDLEEGPETWRVEIGKAGP